eukprot:349923-Chlamydomonas_euryale.AAC.3
MAVHTPPNCFPHTTIPTFPPPPCPSPARDSPCVACVTRATRATCVTHVTCVACVTCVTGVARATRATCVTCVTFVTRVTRVARVTCVTCVTCVTFVTRVTGVTRVTCVGLPEQKCARPCKQWGTSGPSPKASKTRTQHSSTLRTHKESQHGWMMSTKDSSRWMKQLFMDEAMPTSLDVGASQVWSASRDRTIIAHDVKTLSTLFSLGDQGAGVKQLVASGWFVWAFSMKVIGSLGTLCVRAQSIHTHMSMVDALASSVHVYVFFKCLVKRDALFLPRWVAAMERNSTLAIRRCSSMFLSTFPARGLLAAAS